MASHPKMPGTEVTQDDSTESRGHAPGPVSAKDGRLPVSELALDRAAAPSPFGDDQEFPLPADDLNYQHPTPPNEH